MVNETLKQIRVNVLGFSVEEMARKLNMSVSEYERMENERPIPSLILVKVAQAVGMPIEDLLNVQKEEIKFDIKDEWISIYDIERNLSKFLIANREYIDSEPLLGLLKNMVRKPKVAFVGRSDVGKSTLINTLLGNDALPVSWTPTTSIIVYVKHIQDKPSYIDDNVLIFHAGEENELWDDAKLQEREYTESFLSASGDYSLLLDYGARQGRKFEDTNAASAVVFVDSDILKNCDLVDLPGYGTGDREMDDSLLAKMKGADILVYMSLANAFMSENHSYGAAACRHCYGLFEKKSGNMVAAATFSNARRWIKAGCEVRSFEWVRYACSSGMRVAGGMGKVLNRFILDILPDDVMSYADLEWSDGAVYRQLGFVEDGFKSPVLFSVDPHTWQRRPVRDRVDCSALYYMNAGSLKYRFMV